MNQTVPALKEFGLKKTDLWVGKGCYLWLLNFTGNTGPHSTTNAVWPIRGWTVTFEMYRTTRLWPHRMCLIRSFKWKVSVWHSTQVLSLRPFLPTSLPPPRPELPWRKKREGEADLFKGSQTILPLKFSSPQRYSAFCLKGSFSKKEWLWWD